MSSEQLTSKSDDNLIPYFYRTVASPNLNLVIETPNKMQTYAGNFGCSLRLTNGNSFAQADLSISESICYPLKSYQICRVRGFSPCGAYEEAPLR